MKTSIAVAFIMVSLLAPYHVTGSSNLNDRENEIEGSQSGGDYSRPTLRCVSSSECAQNECSVMGMQRYSEPRCEALGGIGAPCRMGKPVGENKTLSFPHYTLECEDVYMQFCPCASGLTCQEAECKPAPRRAPRRPEGFPWAFGRFH